MHTLPHSSRPASEPNPTSPQGSVNSVLPTIPLSADSGHLKTLTLIIGDAPLASILQSIVEAVESRNPAMICSVLLLDRERNVLQMGAAPSLPDFYNQAIHGVIIGPNVGSCGTAAFTGERIIATDLQSDSRWSEFKELAARAGLGSCWSQPIFNGDHRVIGTFAIYHRQPHTPDADDIGTIEAATQLAALAIEQKRNQESLQWRTAFFEAQIESSLDAILIVDSQGKMIQQNRRMAEMWNIPREIAEAADDAARLAFVANQTKDPDAFIKRVTYLYANPGVTGREEIELVNGTVFDRDTSPVYDKSGKFYGRIWRFRDITERKRSDEALRASEERWNFALEGAGDGVWDWVWLPTRQLFPSAGSKCWGSMNTN